MEIENQIDVLHSENMEWLKKLASYSEEINSMQSSIETIAATYTSRAVMSKIEHFQNQLIIHKHRISGLKHSIKNDEKIIQSHDNLKLESHHASAKDQVHTFEKIIGDLKLELNQFLQQSV